LFFGALTSFNELEHALRIKRIHTGLDDEKGAGRFNGDSILILDEPFGTVWNRMELNRTAAGKSGSVRIGAVWCGSFDSEPENDFG